VHRVANGKPWLYPDDPGVVGIITDAAVETRLPVVHLDDIEAAAALIKRSAVTIDELFADATAEG
jgi:molybdopterin-guanine dinucleotide biosynthesis protein B